MITSDRERIYRWQRYSWTGNKYADLYLVDKKRQRGKTIRFSDQFRIQWGHTCIYKRLSDHDFHALCCEWKWQTRLLQTLVKPQKRWYLVRPCDFTSLFTKHQLWTTLFDWKWQCFDLFIFCRRRQRRFDLWYAEWDGINWSNLRTPAYCDQYCLRRIFFQPDGDTLYFSSNRDDGFGGLDIYKPFWIKMEDGLYLIDWALLMPIQGQMIFLWTDRTAPCQQRHCPTRVFHILKEAMKAEMNFMYIKSFKKSEDEIVEQIEKNQIQRFSRNRHLSCTQKLSTLFIKTTTPTKQG